MLTKSEIENYTMDIPNDIQKLKEQPPIAGSAICSANPMIAIAAAWLDAELFMRTGDGSCKHSARNFGYTNRPGGAETADLGRRADSPNATS